MTRLRARLERVLAIRLVRAWTRLNDARGEILAGGIAFFGFFSLVPALTIGFTGFGYLLGGNVGWQRQLAQRVNTSVGFSLIGTGGDPGVVRLDDLVQHEVLTVTGVFGMVVLAVAGLGWLRATREGIRAVFGLPVLSDPVRARVRDVLALGLLGLAVLASLVVGVVVGAATGAVSRWLGWDGTPLAESAVWLGGSLVLLGVDTLIFLLFFTVLSGVRAPVPDLRSGAFLAAVGMQVLKLSAGVLVHRLSSNPLLASSVVVVGLLIWMNLAARLTLLGAAWAANTVADRGQLSLLAQPGLLAGPRAENGDRQGTMGTGTGEDTGSPTGRPGARGGETTMPTGDRDSSMGRLSASSAEPGGTLRSGAGGLERAGGARRAGGRRPSPYARRATPMPVTFGQRSADRATLAAGFVLGAVVLLGFQSIRRAGTILRDVVRP